MMLFQTNYKYFNKKANMLLLLLILMWPLMGQQHVYGESPRSDARTLAIAATDEFGCHSGGGGGGKMLQKNISEIKATIDSETIENKDTSKNEAATIYGHINENDNNSNKLPQDVASKDQLQPNMMDTNMKMSAARQSTASSTIKPATAVVVSSLPPAESLVMPKDQLNKAKYRVIPKKHEKVRGSDNPPDDCEILKVKLNDRRATNNDNNGCKRRENKIAGDRNCEATASSLCATSIVHEIVKVGQNNGSISVDPEIENTESPSPKPFDTMAQIQQAIVSQFAMRWKQIPRVTYFTCKEAAAGNQKQMHKVNAEFIKRMYSSSKESQPMMKVVLIDHLAPQNSASTGSSLWRRGPGFGAAARHTFRTMDWLEQILRPEPLRQIVVVNLSCGISSRRLLEMASSKALFNSMYHWLLLKDYVFNRQTVIDDADDIDGKMSSTDVDKRLEEEIVNGGIATTLQVKKLSTYPTDIVGASTSGSVSGSDSDSGYNPMHSAGKQNNTAPATSASASFSTHKIADDKSSTSLNASRDGITDETDTQTIEKFLAKLNININTELILAKRRMRAITPSAHCIAVPSSNRTPTPTATATATEPASSSSSSSANCASSTDSNDYNTLPEMDYYLLYDVWNPGLQYGGAVNITGIGYFGRLEGFKLHKWYATSSSIRRRRNMQLVRVRCLVVITHENRSDTLEEYLTSHRDTHLDSMNRFNFALLTHVRDLFNFSFILSKTSTWGYLKNGKFDGMIGALVRKQADIGGSPIFFRLERAKVIDYTARTWVARPCFIFRHPASTGKDRIVFLQPFSNDVWILVLVCGCLTVLLLWALTNLERKLSGRSFDALNATYLQNRSLEMRPLSNCFGLCRRLGCGLLCDSFVFYISSLCQQGLAYTTFFVSGRCIMVVALLFSFCIYQFYSASIVGTLLMEKPKTIRTLRDLIHSSMDIGIEDIAYNRDYFLRTKNPDDLELYAKKVTNGLKAEEDRPVDSSQYNLSLANQLGEMTGGQKAKVYRDILHSHETGAHAKIKGYSNWYDPDYGLAKVKGGRFAFHVDVATAYKIIADTFSEREICELAEVELFPPQKMVSIVQKGSPLRKIITYGLRRTTEVGLTAYQRKVWHSPKPRCVKQLHTDDLRVDMQTFTSALFVLIFGYAVSLLILSLEIVHFQLWQRHTTLRT